jgi:ABC-type Fe3+ transport system permease subunit
MSSGTFLALEPIVTWIKVEKPSFDLVGVVLNSFRLAGVLLLLALGLGLLLGAALLRSRRRAAETPIESVSLRLDARG